MLSLLIIEIFICTLESFNPVYSIIGFVYFASFLFINIPSGTFDILLIEYRIILPIIIIIIII